LGRIPAYILRDFVIQFVGWSMDCKQFLKSMNFTFYNWGSWVEVFMFFMAKTSSQAIFETKEK